MENESTIESRLLQYTRIFSLGGAVAGLIGIGIVVFFLAGSESGTYVKFEDIPKENVPEGSEEEKKEVTYEIPENLKKLFTKENKEILEGWMNNIEDDNKEDFLDNMSSIVDDAESVGMDPYHAINNYRDIKQSKLSVGPMEKWKEIGEKVGLYALVFGLFIFNSLMITIFILSSIERNTRKR